MNDDNKFDDQFFDDEDAAFEEEFGEIDIDEEEALEEEFADEYGDDDEWGDEEGDGEFDGSSLVADKKKGFSTNLSFNTIVIIGALVVGAGVMVFQVMTSKPEMVNNMFRSSVKMQGASEGVVFGENQVETVEIKAEPMQQDQDSVPGILEDPTQIEKIATTIKEAPPMPAPIVAETINDEEILLQKNFDQNVGLKADIMGEEAQAAVNRATADEAPALQDNAAVISPIESSEESAGLGDPVADGIETIAPITETSLDDTSTENSAAEALEADVSLPGIDVAANVEEEAAEEEVLREETAIVEMQETVTEAEEESVVLQETTAAITNSDLTDITDRLQTIETQIEGIETKLGQQPVKPENADIEKLNETVAALQKEIQRLKKEAANKPSQKTTSASKKRTSTPKKTSKTPAPQWELRAA
ncbi:MAG: hypothetical protein AAGB32_03065, partial [Pseudomonadota bacterium]